MLREDFPAPLNSKLLSELVLKFLPNYDRNATGLITIENKRKIKKHSVLRFDLSFFIQKRVYCEFANEVIKTVNLHNLSDNAKILLGSSGCIKKMFLKISAIYTI